MTHHMSLMIDLDAAPEAAKRAFGAKLTELGWEMLSADTWQKISLADTDTATMMDRGRTDIDRASAEAKISIPVHSLAVTLLPFSPRRLR